MQHAKDVMKAKVQLVKTDDDIAKACKVLTRSKISGTAVVSNSNKLSGFVSEKDIIAYLSRSKADNKRVKDIMTKKVVSVKESDSIELISKIFSSKPYRRIPVTKSGLVVGMIDRADIMDNLLSEHY